MKQIFIINGSAGVGKDTFVELMSTCLNNMLKKTCSVVNFSSVDKVKVIAKEIGWDGTKSERDRKFLSELKALTGEYYDMSFKSMQSKVDEFYKNRNGQILFLHIREPDEIGRAVKEFNAKTILIVRDSVKHITSNISDENVFNYKYDFIIENNGTIEDLMKKADNFLKRECLKEV